MALPDYLIIGAMRGGTTSLYKYLIAHPRVRRAKSKEIHFFDNFYSRGLKWYSEQFRKKPNQITGEASPNYLWNKNGCAKRIAKDLPNVKLIALLRNPIDRAYSHWQLDRRWRKVSFEEGLEGNPRFLSIGHYDEHLKIWLSLFPRSSFLILKSETFFTNEIKIYKEVLQFLNLEIFIPTVVIERRIYRKGYKTVKRMKEKTRRKLREYYKPHIEELERLLNREFGWE